MEPRARALPNVTLMGFLGVVLLVLGGLFSLGAVVTLALAFKQAAVDAACPPTMVCDASGLGFVIGSLLAAVGLPAVGLGGLMLYRGRRR